MAELHVAIPYKTAQGRIGVSVMTALFPVWALGVPLWLGFFIGSTLKDPASVSAMTIVSTCVGLLAFIVFCVLATAVFEDNRIHVSRDGITLPLFMLARLGFRRHLSWRDLSRAHLVGAGDGAKAPYILLGLRSGISLPLSTAAVAGSDLEQLLLSIELWSSQCERSPELISFQREIQNQGRAEGSIGHTQMWEEELSRRFSATTFMPLEPEAELKGGRLKVVRQLAFGGLSAIYLAQENHRELVVLKESVVPAGAGEESRAQAEAHLAREAALLSSLSHPNIARVFDHFVEDGRHYIVLEYIKGQDLRQFIKQNGPVSQSQAVEWGIAIAEILVYLHGQDPPVLHRDLTPDNLVLTNDGRVILIDFGAANQFVGAATGTIVGKQAYIPAEQLRGKTVPQSDIYALAGTIYFLLTGRDPMPLAPARPRSVREDVSAKLDDLLAQCSSFEPESRPRTALEFAAMLGALAVAPQGEPLVAESARAGGEAGL